MRKVFVVLLALLMAGCASMRGVEVGTDKSSQASVSVENQRTTSVQMFYEDAQGQHSLGTLSAKDSRTFSVPMTSTNVTLVARTQTGTVVLRQPLTRGAQSVTVR